MNVVVNGLMASYQKTGKGEPLVFLHGWGDSSATFTALAGELSAKYEIYMLDLPGFGGTQAPPEAWNLEDYADFLEAWLKKLKLKPLALVGHSYGGAVAVVASGRSKLAGNLILLASAGIRNQRPLRKKMLSAGAKAGKLPLYLLPAHKRQAVRAKLYGSIGSDIMVMPHMEQTFRKIISQDVRQQANQIRIPTLLLYGSRDKDTTVKDGHMLNRAIKGSRMEVIGAGHFLHQEEPRRIAQLIVDFLKPDSPDA